MSVIIIPCRLNSKRLPNKVLLEKNGKPLVWHTWKRARESIAKNIFIASDSSKILHVCKRFGAKTIHTGFAESGTDRCALACSNYREAKYTHIVNLQVDYPDISVESLNKLLDISSILDSNVYTLYYKQKPDSKDDVKIALSKKGEALWFSRYASYPYIHVGAYAYNNLLLQKLSRLEQTEESKMESLEQLTWLQHGVKMNAVETQPTISINTKEDYERWLKI